PRAAVRGGGGFERIYAGAPGGVSRRESLTTEALVSFPSLPRHPIAAHLPALGPTLLLHDLHALHPAHLERLAVPAHHGQTVGSAEGLRVVGGEHPFLGAHRGVLAPAGLVVE